HTRSDRDWSSDVCSSDLLNHHGGAVEDATAETRGAAAGVVDADDGVGAQPRRRPGQPGAHRAEARVAAGLHQADDALYDVAGDRSEERRVGKEGRGRWAR